MCAGLAKGQLGWADQWKRYVESGSAEMGVRGQVTRIYMPYSSVVIE
jgi:hypothetical protein